MQNQARLRPLVKPIWSLEDSPSAVPTRPALEIDIRVARPSWFTEEEGKLVLLPLALTLWGEKGPNMGREVKL